VPGVVIAAVNPDNTPHGYNWTFAFPMLLFIIIALILYALLSRPHRRIPGRPISATSASSQRRPSEAGGAHLTGSVNPEQAAGAEGTGTESEGTESGDSR